MTVRYRAEIDGLRAVAILSVLFFHVGIGFHGGFVGVDVFFVISGYLITGLILKDLDRGQFHIIEFWERRIRRILPPMAVMLLATVVAGWFLLIPKYYQELGQSVLAQATLVSNMYFWKQSGYFAQEAQLRPLFHTWSLAVEEQFYLLFPFLLILIARYSRKSLAVVLLALCGGSFILSVYCSYKHDLANFYLLPTRAWELAIGGFLAALPAQRVLKRWLAESLSVVGMLAILCAVFFYDSNTRFPGASALLPCVGTALIIWANDHSLTSVGKLLALRPVVFIGLISYSLYLWHWPLLVFARFRAIDPLSVHQRIAMVLASVGLAALSWKFVENPFRKKAIFNRRAQIFSFAGATFAVLLSVGLFIDKTDGAPFRLPAQALRYAQATSDTAFRVDLTLKRALDGDFIELGAGDKTRPIKVMVWGDSHAMSALPVVDALCKDYSVRGVGATHSAEAPFVGYLAHEKYSLMADSITFNDAVVSFIRKNHVPDLLVVASWEGMVAADHGADRLHRGLVDTVAALKDSGTRIWILKSTPTQPWNVPNALTTAFLYGRDPQSLGKSLEVFRADRQREAPIFEGVEAPNLIYLDPINVFAGPNDNCMIAKDGYALYFDTHHLTVHGSMLLRPLFEPIFAQSRKR